MSTMQRLTLIGLYSYDNTLFDNLVLPEGYDKNTFIDTLLLEHGEKAVMYPELDFMKFSIGAVSRKWQLELERIYQALTAEYDPTWNYDRHEEYKDIAKREYKDKVTSDNSDTASQSVDGKTETTVSAYNSSVYEPDRKVATNDGTKTVKHSGVDSDATGDSTNTVEHKAHLYGNIGVTTATQMINEVLDQRLNRNLYGLACDIFARELTIGIY